jgi:CheY-like chemotaxis protein
MMPTMDGYEVLRSIKEQTSFEVPIIVCSNLSQEQDREKAFQL